MSKSFLHVRRRKGLSFLGPACPRVLRTAGGVNKASHPQTKPGFEAFGQVFSVGKWKDLGLWFQLVRQQIPCILTLEGHLRKMAFLKATKEWASRRAWTPPAAQFCQRHRPLPHYTRGSGEAYFGVWIQPPALGMNAAVLLNFSFDKQFHSCFPWLPGSSLY